MDSKLNYYKELAKSTAELLYSPAKFIKTTADNLIQEDTDTIFIFNNEEDAADCYLINNYLRYTDGRVYPPSLKLVAYTYRIKSKDYYAIAVLIKQEDKDVEPN